MSSIYTWLRWTIETCKSRVCKSSTHSAFYSFMSFINNWTCVACILMLPLFFFTLNITFCNQNWTLYLEFRSQWEIMVNCVQFSMVAKTWKIKTMAICPLFISQFLLHTCNFFLIQWRSSSLKCDLTMVANCWFNKQNIWETVDRQAFFRKESFFLKKSNFCEWFSAFDNEERIKKTL